MRTDRLALVLLVVYLAVLATLTLRPVGADAEQAVRVNLRPWATIGPALRLGLGSFPFRVLVGNFVAFVPFGVLLPAAVRRLPWPAVLVAGLALSVAIELSQYGLSLYLGHRYRSADVDDVIVNVAGTATGLALFAIARAGARLLRRRRSAG